MQLRNFGYLLKEVSRRYVLRFEQWAQQIPLTLPPCIVLAFLENHQGIGQSKLAERISIEPMALVRILDRMEADGLVERKPDPLDRRARRLYFTPKSKPALDEVWRLADLTRSEAFEGISPSKRDVFFDVLAQLDRNLRRLEGSPVDAASSSPTSVPVPKSAAGKGRARGLPAE
jgi:MarR family transcriptional regulator, transcriptional regulator for hemolysin